MQKSNPFGLLFSYSLCVELDAEVSPSEELEEDPLLLDEELELELELELGIVASVTYSVTLTFLGLTGPVAGD